MYPHINEIILACFARDIKVGLVTNGLRLDDLNTEALSTITWCRISCCDERYLNQVPADIIEDAVKRGICVDWAFSYVVGRNYNPDNLKVYIQLANKYNFTHIRVVTDLVDLEKGIDIEKVRESVAGIDSIWDEVQTGHATANSFGLFLDSKVSDAGGGALTAQVIWEYTTRSITGATAGDYSDINNDITKGTTVY